MTSKKYYFYVDNINKNFPGFSLITANILKYINNVNIIHSFEDRTADDIIIPMGVVGGMHLMKTALPTDIIFLVDSPTLGYKSICKAEKKENGIFNKILIGEFLRLIKYLFIEKRIVRKFNKIIVVSKHDQEYLENKYKVNKFYTITNGANFPDLSNQIKRKFDFSLGILAFWGVGALRDVDWFIQKYLPRLKKKFPSLRLVIAGRGADERVINYFKEHNIVFLGEVESLESFFNEIDIYITTVRKECGILNKVLDSFANKKIVLGLEHNMYAFKDQKPSFYTYNSYEECENQIKYISENQDDVRSRIENAYEYLEKGHQWSKNMKSLENIIENTINNHLQ